MRKPLWNSLYFKFQLMLHKLSRYAFNNNSDRSLDYEDFYQQSIVYLYEIYSEYDPERNMKFSTFLYTRLRQLFLDEIRLGCIMKKGGIEIDIPERIVNPVSVFEILDTIKKDPTLNKLLIDILEGGYGSQLSLNNKLMKNLKNALQNL